MSNKESGVCPQCKVVIPNEASFCGQCGWKVSSSDVNTEEPSGFNIKFLLLDWNGRIGRLQFLVAYITIFVTNILLNLIGAFWLVDLPISFVSLFMIYPAVAVMRKRLRDRGHSAWFLLLMIVPLINLGFLGYLFLSHSKTVVPPPTASHFLRTREGLEDSDRGNV